MAGEWHETDLVSESCGRTPKAGLLFTGTLPKGTGLSPMRARFSGVFKKWILWGEQCDSKMDDVGWLQIENGRLTLDLDMVLDGFRQGCTTVLIVSR